MRGSPGTQTLLRQSYHNTYSANTNLELNMNRYAVPMYTSRESTLSAVITAVSGSGATVTYTADNSFTAGQSVVVSGTYADGINPDAYNISGTVATATATQFTITNTATGTYSGGGVATVSEVYWTRANYDAYMTAMHGPLYDSDMPGVYSRDRFPIMSVVSPVRPKAGILKPPFGKYDGTVSPALTRLKWWNTTSWNNPPKNPAIATYNSSGDYYTLGQRNYYSADTDSYKYYQAGFNSSNARITQAYIQYVNPIWTNKVVVRFENSLYAPYSYSVELRIGGSWISVYSTSGLAMTKENNPSGDLVLWNTNNNRGASPNGTWGLAAPVTSPVSTSGLDYCRQITGVRVNVTATVGVFTTPESTTSGPVVGAWGLIEVSPRTVIDVSQYVSGWNVDENIAEGDSLAPLGTVSANTAGLELDNSTVESDGLYTFETRRTQSSAPFLGEFAKKFARFTLDVILNSETIRQIDMSADTWDITEGDTASIALVDDASVLQGTAAPNILLRNVTPTQAIWRILDNVGFNNYKLRMISGSTEPVIDWIHTDDSQTVWDAIKEICESHKYAVWFDSSGALNIGTRAWLFSRGRASKWSFTAVGITGDIADIVSHSETTTEPLNNVIVRYTPQSDGHGYDAGDPSGAAPNNSTIALVRADRSQVFYNPDNQIVLGLADLAQSMTATQTYMRIASNSYNAGRWGAFSGNLMIDQEIIGFDGAEFSYYDQTAGSTRYAVVKTSADLGEIYTRALGAVKFTGKLVNLTRGKLNTLPAAHNIWTNDWSVASGTKNVSQSSGVSPKGVTICDSRATVTPNTFFGMYKDLSAAAGADGSVFKASKLNRFAVKLTLGQLKTRVVGTGTKKKTETYIANDNGAGIVLCATKNGSNVITTGYYIELRSSAKQELEVAILEITSATNVRRSVADGAKYFNFNVTPGDDTDLTVTVHRNSSYVTLKVFCNGHHIGSRSFPAATFGRLSGSLVATNRVALMTSGPTYATFSWFGASSFPADSQILHNDYLGHLRGLAESLLQAKKKARQYTGFYFEAFDNLVREAFIDEVRFTKSPAMNLRWWMTPTSGLTMNLRGGSGTPGTMPVPIPVARPALVAAAVTDVNPVSATVALINISNTSIILSDGDSGKNYPELFGRMVERVSGEVVVNKIDEGSRITNGDRKFEVSPKWVTNRASAEAVAQWILDNSKNGNNVHTMSVYSNPLVEIGDIVTVTYPLKNLTAATKFLVRAVKQNWSDGIETEVELVKL